MRVDEYSYISDYGDERDVNIHDKDDLTEAAIGYMSQVFNDGSFCIISPPEKDVVTKVFYGGGEYIVFFNKDGSSSHDKA